MKKTTKRFPKLQVKVSNFTSSRGNDVPNQFTIKVGPNTYFQSYNSVIALERPGKKTILDERYWNYSRTTGKYRNQFLGETLAETRRKIEDGTYLLANLNER